MKTKSVRHSNCKLDDASSEKYPEMVEIVKTPKALKMLNGKRFVNLDKAKIAIDYQSAMNRIENGNMKSVMADLESVVIMDEY